MPGTEVSFTSVKLAYKVLDCITAFSYTYRYVYMPSCFFTMWILGIRQVLFPSWPITLALFFEVASQDPKLASMSLQPKITLNLNSSGFYLLTTNQATPSPLFLFISLATLPFFLPPLAGSLFPPNRSPLQLSSYTQSTSLQPHPIPLP